MQIKLFTIPILQAEERNEELNKFLRTHKIADIEKQLVQSGSTAYWSFCIQYFTELTESRAENRADNVKIDYREKLSAEEFTIFSKLREIRKAMAIEDAVPVFRIFTDFELAEIARLEEPNANNIRSIKGIGDAKAEKFGIRLLSKLL